MSSSPPAPSPLHGEGGITSGDPAAFDGLAEGYDAAFSHRPIGRFLRGVVQARLAAHFRAGDHVLEMGCGTGEDALWLAERGIRVTATDASETMLAVTRAKCAGQALVEARRLDLAGLRGEEDEEELNRRDAENTEEYGDSTAKTQSTQRNTAEWDGGFSSFGAMNCLEDWRGVAGWLGERIRPGGIVGLGVMSPWCVWEPLWHGLHGDWRTATRRWRRKTLFQGAADGQATAVTYPSIGRLSRDFAPYFERIHVQPLGLFLPPSDVFGVIEKRPRLMRLLMALEARFGRARLLAALADHYWVEFRRRESNAD
ncbi:MAG: methyltransferase domain-containing protein [Anaerolineae bacterium]|nr:methyltransferase domain-containing protein [Anaerolineae bacterium]